MKQLRPRLISLTVALLAFTTVSTIVLAQYPVWPGGTGPMFVQGPTLTATLRNAAQATSDQARLTARTAAELARRAQNPADQMQTFAMDYQNLRLQFQNLRLVFNQLGELVIQLQSPRAANAAAELDAGLTLIAEVFVPVEQELQAGGASRDTVARMGRVLSEVLAEWQKELKKDTARLGMIR